MPKITFVTSDAAYHEIEAETGISIMDAARKNNISGIEAECGGACVCATCCVNIEKDWLDVVGRAYGVELELLEAYDKNEEAARLSCQIIITDAMDGMMLRVPDSQG